MFFYRAVIQRVNSAQLRQDATVFKAAPHCVQTFRKCTDEELEELRTHNAEMGGRHCAGERPSD